MNFFFRTVSVAVIAASLAACGGGGGSNSAVSSIPIANSAQTTPSNINQTPSSTSSPASTAVQSEDISASPNGPTHAPILEQLSGAFRTSQEGWNTIGKYVDYLITDKRAARYAANAGMQVGIYTDAIRVHGGDMLSWPENAFAHSCNGQRVWVGDAGEDAQLGDPRSASLRDTWYGEQHGMLSDQYGNYPYSFVFADDSANPGEIYDSSVYKYGSRFGPAATPIYCGYDKSSWYSAVRDLYQNAPLKVIFNDDTSSEYYSYMQGQSNVLGGMCEGCLTSPYLGHGEVKVTGTAWQEQMQAGLTDVANNKLFVLSPDGQVDADAMGYAYASYMLLYDQQFTLFRENGIPTVSGLQEPPTVQLVPTQPRIPTPSNLSALLWPTGVYAREYKACYIKGQLVGPCATVVNPDPTSSHAWPFLIREYHHGIQIGGNGAISELGDDGWVNAKGGHPGDHIEPSSWAIAFN